MIRSVPKFTFETMPTFHQLWESCMEQHLTPTTDAVIRLLYSSGIDSGSKLLDTCVGGGGLAVELLGYTYDMTMADGDSGMLALFEKNALKKGLHKEGLYRKPILAKWQEFPSVFSGCQFDGLICCGNSLIYAGGYWNHDGVVDRQLALTGIRETLAIFRRLLVPGGHLFVDKPSDNEQPTEDLVACINVAGDVYDVFFSVRFAGDRRTAQILLRHQVTGEEMGTPNVAYRLKDSELEELLLQAGFASFERVAGGVNSHLPLWVARVL